MRGTHRNDDEVELGMERAVGGRKNDERWRGVDGKRIMKPFQVTFDAR